MKKVDWIDVSEDPIDIGFYWVISTYNYEPYRCLYKGDGLWECNGHDYWTLYDGIDPPSSYINK